MGDILEDLKVRDPKRYESAKYARRIFLLLLAPTFPIIYWLDSQLCSMFPFGNNPRFFIFTFIIILLCSVMLLTQIVIRPLLARKFGKAEMLREQEEMRKEADIRIKEERASGKYKGNKGNYALSLSSTLFSLFTGLFCIILFLMNDKLGFPSLSAAWILAATLGGVISAWLTYKKVKNKFKD